MLKSIERSTAFVLFCVFTAACVGLEVYLCYSMIAMGFTVGKAVTGVLNLTVLYATWKAFLTVVSREPEDVISFSKLDRFSSDRYRLLEKDIHAGLDDYATRQYILTEILRFAEEFLHEWLPGSHFELSIFIDRDQPLLFAHFDSNHESTAKSMEIRERNSHWYLENKYEVTKLFSEPSSHPRIIYNTEDKKNSYFFSSDQRRKQLRSTMLWCIDLDAPCAIVVSSNARNAFQEADPEVVAFIKFIGNMSRFYLHERGFLYRIYELRPDLFPPEAIRSVDERHSSSARQSTSSRF
ncbi:hypothetical protein [Granulicella sp. S156]|uniref:hypothetical protein n=1 Tax=Granulicella sp. S156 TaxID=1747224 RepID=UPI00131C9C22|nr:hypothetical protein [Granulicella sp. S156]